MSKDEDQFSAIECCVGCFRLGAYTALIENPFPSAPQNIPPIRYSRQCPSCNFYFCADCWDKHWCRGRKAETETQNVFGRIGDKVRVILTYSGKDFEKDGSFKSDPPNIINPRYKVKKQQ